MQSINMVNARLKERDRIKVVKKLQELLSSGKNSHQKVSKTTELVYADLSISNKGDFFAVRHSWIPLAQNYIQGGKETQMKGKAQQWYRSPPFHNDW